MNKGSIVLYHAGCWDGFGAAWVAWRYFGDSAQYIAVQHGQALPTVDFHNKLVYILDFSYDRPVLDQIADEALHVVVIDHHATAKQSLIGFKDSVFDESHSGAVLTWQRFYADQPIPMLLSYVEDRDLWSWLLPQSKAYNAGLRSYPLDFELWQELADKTNQLITEGHAILREQQKVIDSHARHAVEQDFFGHMVPVVNATVLYSEIGHALLDHFPDAPFAVTYFIVEETQQIVYNLRSGGRFHVGNFAKEQGGGGHANAAGFHRVINLRHEW